MVNPYAGTPKDPWNANLHLAESSILTAYQAEV